jgi:hypothetical protein
MSTTNNGSQTGDEEKQDEANPDSIKDLEKTFFKFHENLWEEKMKTPLSERPAHYHYAREEYMKHVRYTWEILCGKKTNVPKKDRKPRSAKKQQTETK